MAFESGTSRPLRADPGAGRGRCRSSPTASSRSSPCSAARASRSSPATRTSPPAPPRRSAATSPATPRSSRRSPPTSRTPASSSGSRTHPQELRPRSSASSARSRCSTRPARVVAIEPRRRAARLVPDGRRRSRSTASRCRRSGWTTTCCRRACSPCALTRLNQPAGWLVGEFSLEEMWRMVDGIRIGEHGFALVVAPDGALVAHGDPDKKALVAQARNISGHPLVAGGARPNRRGCEYTRRERHASSSPSRARSSRSAGP